MFQFCKPTCMQCIDSLQSDYLPAFYKCYVDTTGNNTENMEMCCKTPVSTTTDGCFKWCVQDYSSDNSKYFEPFEKCLGDLSKPTDMMCIHGGYTSTEHGETCPISPVPTTPTETINPRNQTKSASATQMRAWSKFATGLLASLLMGQTLADDSSIMALSNCTHPMFGR